MIAWIRLKFLEAKLAFAEFGQQTKYRRLCLERNAATSEKLQIAREVLADGATSINECRCHTIYLKEHEKA